MFDVSNRIDDPGVCATCDGALAAGQLVRLHGAALQPFCSRPCLDAAVRAQRLARRAAWLRAARRLTLILIVLGAWLGPLDRLWPRRAGRVSPTVTLPPAPKRDPPPLPPGWFGPEWPPTETSVLAVLGRDAWVHPLAGPARRMPRSDTRVFGADRPGNRAIECRNGHCGVDLGGEIWGEHVRAVHDGVVDWVQRGANPEHGGRFVRLSHHGGTVFTQYFHLAAIPRGLERGAAVKGGQVIGLLGDSGVIESQPHLHFAVSVRLAEGREKYMDPEPLIALWPLRIPIEGSQAGLVTITAPPGFPLGSALRRSRAKNDAKRKAGARNAAAPDEVTPSESLPDEPIAEPETENPEPSGQPE